MSPADAFFRNTFYEYTNNYQFNSFYELFRLGVDVGKAYQLVYRFEPKIFKIIQYIKNNQEVNLTKVVADLEDIIS